VRGQSEPEGWFLKYTTDQIRAGRFDSKKYPYPYVCVQAGDGTQEEMVQVQDVVATAVDLRQLGGWRLVNVLMTDGIALGILTRGL
jgi:hypothetical protein